MFARVLLAALLAATMAFAQRTGGGRRGGSGDDMANMASMRPQRQSRALQFADKLKLSKEQREQVDGFFREALTKAAPIRAQIDKSRADIAGAMIGDKSQDEIKKMMEAHAALEAQMDLVEAETFSKIYAALKPNQQSKAGQAFELMAGLFDHAASGGAPRGGR